MTPNSLSPTDVATLQRSHGNQVVQRLLHNSASPSDGAVQRWSLGGMWESTKSTASDAWEGTKNVAKNSWEGTKNVASTAWEGTKSVAKNSWEGTKNVASSAWEGTKEIASDTWEGTKKLAKNAWNGTKKAGKAVGRGVKKAAKAVADTAGAVADQVYNSDYTDLNAKQFRVSRNGSDVLVEQVVGERNEEGNLVYSAVGKVVGYESNRPIMEMYDKPRALNGWVPRVTHLNGMMVNPQEGIGSATALHQEVNNVLNQESALDEKGIDVLYTYSATQGFGADLAECMIGKVYIDDKVTERQEDIMMDAIRRKQRTTVSAHSRGTIKTDNAVRN
ncbi:MAG: hypothetical protein H0T73_13780, partial [Ardenticatenales bacterium]|nr:hypothetical protein [Ardenticatenales bacterium]